MWDKKKIAWAAGLGVLVLALAIGGLIYVLNTAGHPGGARSTTPPPPVAAPSTAPTSASDTPVPAGTASPADSRPPSGAYSDVLSPTKDVQELATRAALAASKYDGGEATDARQRRYRQAQFTDALAASYTPVWTKVFGDNKTAKVKTTSDNHPGLRSVKGSDGHHTYVFGVTCVYEGSWTKDGHENKQRKASATWWVTVDEATSRVTAIEDPATDDLQIRVG